MKTKKVTLEITIPDDDKEYVVHINIVPDKIGNGHVEIRRAVVKVP